MNDPGILERIRVREVVGVFPSHDATAPVVDELLLAGFDHSDIDVSARAAMSPAALGTPVPAMELADIPGAPRVGPATLQDRRLIVALCAALLGCFGALIGAMAAIASDGTSVRTAAATIVGGAVGCGLGVLIARSLGVRWRQTAGQPAGTDGVVLWVRIRKLEQEQRAMDILRSHGADGVRVHEIEIDKRLEDLPLSSFRVDPWLGSEPLGTP